MAQGRGRACYLGWALREGLPAGSEELSPAHGLVLAKVKRAAQFRGLRHSVLGRIKGQQELQAPEWNEQRGVGKKKTGPLGQRSSGCLEDLGFYLRDMGRQWGFWERSIVISFGF